jgi:hypothetical protein
MPISYVTAASLDGTQNGSAPIYGARAWVNFNGTGTVAIRASGNVSSITDNGTGDYTVNFTTAMPDANYCAVSQASRDNNSGFAAFVAHGLADSQTTTSCRVVTGYDGGVFDIPRCNVAIFR